MSLWLRQVALVAGRLEPVLDDLQAVLGLEVAHRDPEVATFGLENAVLPVGSQFLEVVAPVQPGTAAGRQLERRGGDGGYMVITQCDDHPRRQQRAAELGIRTVFEFERSGYHCMQLHPSDTGGSFLEIDRQEGDDPAGAWAPAGSHWQDAVRTDVVTTITGVEVQVAKPEEVAARWSEVVEIDLRNDAEGRPVLPLDNATVAFVLSSDGRGDGLSRVGLTVVDRDAALGEAQRRGLPTSDGTVTICGTRFTLTA